MRVAGVYSNGFEFNVPSHFVCRLGGKRLSGLPQLCSDLELPGSAPGRRWLDQPVGQDPFDHPVAAACWMECGQVLTDSVVLPIPTDVPFVPEDSSAHG